MDRSFYSKDSIFKIPNHQEFEQFGDDSSPILFCVNKEDYETHQDLFLKITKSIKIENPRTIICSSDAQYSLQSLYDQNPFQHIIFFYVNIRKLGLQLQIRSYHWTITETYDLLFVDNLDKLSSDKNAKQKLWSNFQKLL